jgi:hypothetical protein
MTGKLKMTVYDIRLLLSITLVTVFVFGAICE